MLKRPNLFAAAASWDFAADMSTYDQFGSSSANNYGTDDNFQANYRPTPSLSTHKAPFPGKNRIWIGGYNGLFQPDVADHDALLTWEKIAHTTEAPQQMAHRLARKPAGTEAAPQLPPPRR